MDSGVLVVLGISTGMFISIISGATPLKNEPWGLANKMTSKALDQSEALVDQDVVKRFFLYGHNLSG